MNALILLLALAALPDKPTLAPPEPRSVTIVVVVRPESALPAAPKPPVAAGADAAPPRVQPAAGPATAAKPASACPGGVCPTQQPIRQPILFRRLRGL